MPSPTSRSEYATQPFGERERAEYLSRKFLEIGLSDVQIDEAGNCLGLLRGLSQSPMMVVSAHLDTVFSRETDFTVRRKDQRLFAPGISDDGCGLVALITIARALVKTGTKTSGSILFVGTVGEEGQGDLRGVRYLYRRTMGRTVESFITLMDPESSASRIEHSVHIAIASRSKELADIRGATSAYPIRFMHLVAQYRVSLVIRCLRINGLHST
jgi:acetylornithine deacetylase/succinyl-diaminopimelate desuccinylase-like protein